MRVQTNAVRFKADKKLMAYIDKKVAKLEQFFSKIIEANLFLRLENSGQIKDKIVELKLSVPGETLIVKEQGKTFEESVEMAVETMKRVLKRYKDKLYSKR